MIALLVVEQVVEQASLVVEQVFWRKQQVRPNLHAVKTDLFILALIAQGAPEDFGRRGKKWHKETRTCRVRGNIAHCGCQDM